MMSVRKSIIWILEYEMGERMTRARVWRFMGHLARNCVRVSAYYLNHSSYLFLNDE